MSDSPDDPGPRRLALEIAVYVLLFLLVGGAFVLWRYSREGPRILQVDPRRAR